MDQPKPIQPRDSLSWHGNKIDEAWVDCPKTIVPRHMKASLHARFSTKVSLSVAYEARSARFFYRTNLSPAGACNIENLIVQIQHGVDSRLPDLIFYRRNKSIRRWIRVTTHL